MSVLSIASEKKKIYNSIVQEYSDLIMTKKNETTLHGVIYGVYYAKISCLLYVENRYVIAVKSNDQFVPIDTELYLSNIVWDSFQTRTIDECPYSRQLSIQTIPFKPKQNSTVLNTKIKKIKHSLDRSVYAATTMPVVLEILHDDEDDEMAQESTIQSALDTFKCIVKFTV